MARNTHKPVFSWHKTTVEQQRKLLEYIGGDGHTIWNADALKADAQDTVAIDYIVDAFTRTERSDGSYKGSLFDGQTGEYRDTLRGVYGLTVIRSLAAHYDVHSSKFGRGSEARELTEGILARIGKESEGE